MCQRSGKWTMDSLRLLRAVQQVPASQRRDVLLQQADLDNKAARTLLKADKEINFVRYYGLSRYLQEKQVLPPLPSFLPKTTSATTETAETKPRLWDSDKRAAQVPFMITKSMRDDLKGLQYSEDSVRKMTPAKANVVLKHKLPPERYEVEIESLVEQENKTIEAEAAQSEAAIMSPADSSPESQDQGAIPLHDALTVNAQTEKNGRIWFEVIEQCQGKDPAVVGLFAQENEALSCQKVYEELARKKNSKSTYTTKQTRKP